MQKNIGFMKDIEMMADILDTIGGKVYGLDEVSFKSFVGTLVDTYCLINGITPIDVYSDIIAVQPDVAKTMGDAFGEKRPS